MQVKDRIWIELVEMLKEVLAYNSLLIIKIQI